VTDEKGDDTSIDDLFDNVEAPAADPEEMRRAVQRDREERARAAAKERAEAEALLREKSKIEFQGTRFAVVATLIVLGLLITFIVSALHAREKRREPEHAGKNETHHAN
jgi:hypothetical protein